MGLEMSAINRTNRGPTNTGIFPEASEPKLRQSKMEMAGRYDFIFANMEEVKGL